MIILYTQNLAKQIGLGNRKIDLPEFANPDAFPNRERVYIPI